MAWKSEPVEIAFSGVTPQTLRTFPGGSVTDSVLIGLNSRNTDTIEHGYLIRHNKAGTFTDVWAEQVPSGKSLQGPIPCVGMNAADESFEVSLTEAIATSNPRIGGTFVDKTP